MREILHQCYKFGFEVKLSKVDLRKLPFIVQFHKELDRLITGEGSRGLLAQGIIQFSMQWMR